METNKSVTAVEWLEKRFQSLGFDFEHILKEAKAMEKQQIIDAVDCCLSSIQLSEDKNSFIALSAEQYYNERFILKTI